MSDDLIRRAREALVNVTPGPWAVGVTEEDYAKWFDVRGIPDADGWTTVVSDEIDLDADARFISVARDLVPAMAARLEAQEALLREAMEALGMAVDDLDEWVACGDSLAQAGFNVDGTADCAERARATLAKLRAHLDGRADEGGVPNGI